MKVRFEDVGKVPLHGNTNQRINHMLVDTVTQPQEILMKTQVFTI